MIRTFIAIELPAELKKEITSIQQQFKPHFDRTKVSWVRPDNVHLTLKFLGDVLSANISGIVKACNGIKSTSVFELHLNGIGFFPGLRKPKVLWCGYEDSAALSGIQRQIERTLVQSGFAAEERPFVPHITLARIKEIGSKPSTPFYVDMDAVQEGIKRLPVSFRHPVFGIKLIRSKLSPKGSEYSVLHEWKLKAD